MITVIVPVYNSEKYVNRIYNCVLAQTYRDWELIFIDDGSIDGSSALCDSLCVENGRVRVIHQSNKGASVARRVGIENAKGEYLVFIDSDDIVENDYIEKLWNNLQKYKEKNIQIAVCDMIVHEENSDVEIDKSKTAYLLDEDKLQQMFFSYHFWGYGGKIYHKSVFDGIYFPSYTINEDYVVMAQLFNKYKKVVYLPVALYHYMRHEESLSHQNLSKRMFDEYYNKVWVKKYYEEVNPKWTKYAEAQLFETCVKLLRCVVRSDSEGLYCKERDALRRYLRWHVCGMVMNCHLKFGVKVVALSLLL